jgi:SulP family sulfate permease
MHRVRSVDLTAVHMLEQCEAQVHERGGALVFSSLPKALPSGENLRAYFDEAGLALTERPVRRFDQLTDALEWIEDTILDEEGRGLPEEEAPLGLRDIDFLKGRGEDTLRQIAECAVERCYAAGERIFRQGDVGDEIFLVRRGRVRIALRFDDGQEHHVATFGRGDAFGDIAFLDGGARSADAVALTRTDLLVLSRRNFDVVAEQHPRLGHNFFAALARSLAIRLRQADTEIRVLGDS